MVTFDHLIWKCMLTSIMSSLHKNVKVHNVYHWCLCFYFRGLMLRFWKVFKGPLPRKPSDLLLFLGRNCISDQRFLWARKCRVVKRSRLPAKIASYLFSIGWLLCLAFLYGWHFLNKVSLYWPLITLTTHWSTSKLSDNPGDCFLLTKMPCWNCQREEEMGHLP